MKLKLLTLIGIVMLIAGFTMIFIGYSTPNTATPEQEVPEQEPQSPVFPEEPGTGEGGSTTPPEWWEQFLPPWFPVKPPAPLPNKPGIPTPVPPSGGSSTGGSGGGSQIPYNAGVDSWTLVGAIVAVLGILLIMIGGGKR